MAGERHKVTEDVIVKPRPLEGFPKDIAIYVPLDTSSQIIGNWLEEKALMQKKTPFGRYIRLDNKTILYQCVGAPSAVIALERLIASGVAEILILGFCGALNPELSLLDTISVEKALSEEGTSRHYFPRRRTFRASSHLRRKTEMTLSSRNLPFQRGTAVSIDAPFRETRAWLKDKQKRGIDVVDMEASAVFALGEYYTIPTAAVMIVSDELSASEWKIGFRDPRMDERIEDYFFPIIDG